VQLSATQARSLVLAAVVGLRAPPVLLCGADVLMWPDRGLPKAQRRASHPPRGPAGRSHRMGSVLRESHPHGAARQLRACP
jgi:hypothetical protein